MSGRKGNKQSNIIGMLIVCILLAAVFAAICVWGVSAAVPQPYQLLFICAMVLYSVLYIAAIMIIVHRYTQPKSKPQTGEDESWFDRTMNLSALPELQTISVEYEITAIHSDIIVT